MAASDNDRTETIRFDEEVDVVVVGYGFAGGVSAIEAHDAGAQVLVVEKMPDPGGISICSHGAICSTTRTCASFLILPESFTTNIINA